MSFPGDRAHSQWLMFSRCIVNHVQRANAKNEQLNETYGLPCWRRLAAAFTDMKQRGGLELLWGLEL